MAGPAPAIYVFDSMALKDADGRHSAGMTAMGPFACAPALARLFDALAGSATLARTSPMPEAAQTLTVFALRQPPASSRSSHPTKFCIASL